MVHATVNGFGISADYNGDGLWSIGLTRPDSTMNITATGVNQFLTFTIPISLPLTVDIDTSTNSSVSMRTLGTSGGHAEVQVVLAATGWAQFSPTEAAPPPGDFNGDGFVDGSDFLALQRGIGTDLAPSLSQGDANHDGIIDALDVQSWKSSFGSSLLASSVASPEPATGTIALALLWLPLSCSRTACRGLDRSTRKQSP
jgi:hypothetical protein